MYFNLALYFYDVARKHEANSAINHFSRTVSYKELNILSNRLANFLVDEGIKKNDVIAIINTKKPFGYIAMLACLKIGAIYTCIDEESPRGRLIKIFNVCKPSLLVSDCELSQEIKECASSFNLNFFELLDDGLFSYKNGENLALSSNILGSTPAYIMFTSGSTGEPKGVTITHSNLLSFLGWSINRYNITPNDSFAAVSPAYFDNSVFDFYTALFSGASLVPIDKIIISHPLELVRLIDNMKCTVWFSVPSLLVYLQTMKVLNTSTFQSIRIFTFGGEGYPKSELKKLYDLYGHRSEFINVYGPTEGTCICSSYTLSDVDFSDMNKLSPLGTINPNFDYLIVNDRLEVVADGAKGELCILGPNIALGYYNDGARTDAAFIQNPFIETHRDIMYRTGDLVYEQDGLLWFAGRIDNQIKHLGYRIELEEIETALNGLDYVEQSAVIYHKDNERYGKIYAFVKSNTIIEESAIFTDLKNQLPSYMLPSCITFLDELPKNANGKVDRRSLLKNIL